MALERVNYIVADLAACQKANGDGYVLPVDKRVYEELRQGRIKASGFSLNDEWVPNYTLHKVFAGLHDAWNFAGNKQALEIEKQLADFLTGVYQNLTPAQAQEILKAESGGMNEVFADLTAATSDPSYLELARTVFHHDAVLGPLEHGPDKWNGQHGNTQIRRGLRPATCGNQGEIEGHRPLSGKPRRHGRRIVFPANGNVFGCGRFLGQ